MQWVHNLVRVEPTLASKQQREHRVLAKAMPSSKEAWRFYSWSLNPYQGPFHVGWVESHENGWAGVLLGMLSVLHKVLAGNKGKATPKVCYFGCLPLCRCLLHLVASHCSCDKLNAVQIIVHFAFCVCLQQKYNHLCIASCQHVWESGKYSS